MVEDVVTNVPTVIVRPAAISPTWNSPIPGTSINERAWSTMQVTCRIIVREVLKYNNTGKRLHNLESFLYHKLLFGTNSTFRLDRQRQLLHWRISLRKFNCYDWKIWSSVSICLFCFNKKIVPWKLHAEQKIFSDRKRSSHVSTRWWNVKNKYRTSGHDREYDSCHCSRASNK